MNILTLVLIALGLAMDAFAVSVASGAGYKQLHVKHILRIAIFFGAFQAIMPLIGFLAGNAIIDIVNSYAHWIAFALLVFIGVKMIIESFHMDKSQPNPAEIAVLLTLSLATSIDALAVGFTLSILKLPILFVIIIIGLITFILSLVGVHIGKKAGHIFEGKIEIAGGLILIGIGVKILIKNLFFK